MRPMCPTRPSRELTSTPLAPRSRPVRLRRRGLSVILIVIVMLVLVGFVSLAVDVGRLRLAKVQLQTAADAAATAGASGLEFSPAGVIEAQDRAYDAALRNFSIDRSGAGGARADSAVELVVDEDVEFGIWRESTRTFERLIEQNGGIDERRQANAVRAWARRVTKFEDPDGYTVERNTALPLIFGPVIGVHRGEVSAVAIARLQGGRSGFGFIGLDFVRFNGTTNLDSYDAANETYPGVGGPNDLASVSSNGDITLIGATEIWGDVHPGVEGNVLPYPLRGNVEVTGYMDPLDEPLNFTATPWNPPTSNYNLPGSIDPPNALNGSLDFSLKGNARNGTLTGSPARPADGEAAAVQFRFASLSVKAQDVVRIRGSCDIHVGGDMSLTGGGQIRLEPATPGGAAPRVRFFINGDLDAQGGTIINPGLPADLEIHVTRGGTTVDIGGTSTFYGHIYAPLSDITIHGTPGFFGWAIGKSLTVNGTSQLHYDETGLVQNKPFTVDLVD